MENANKFREKIQRGDLCLGTGISLTDPTVTEALSSIFDFVWIDMEHNALSIETVQAHIMATKGSDTTALVRVPGNDPAIIKPVLDVGADGIIVPWIRTADDARLAVSTCRYPPEGTRGFGPRRPSRYGRINGVEFCQRANKAVITAVQIEHVDAVENLDEILAVPGLTSIVVGPMDLSGSLGHMAEPCHPEVMGVIEMVLGKARRSGVFAGIAFGDDPTIVIEWIKKGAQWVSIGNDSMLLLAAADKVVGTVREKLLSQLARPGTLL